MVVFLGITITSAWAQSIRDITWTPASPAAGSPVTFHVKVLNPGPTAPICIRLLTPGGTPDKQAHPGIGIRKDPPIDVAFKPVVYAKPGVYEVTAQMMDKSCEKLLPKILYRTERITVAAPVK